MALTSSASESSSSSATKETTCVGHCPWRSARFWSVYWPTLEPLCDTTLTRHLVNHEILWVEILLCHTGKKFLFQVVTTCCEKQGMGDFWWAQVRRCLLHAGEWTWIYTLRTELYHCILSLNVWKHSLLQVAFNIAAAEMLVCEFAVVLCVLCLHILSVTQQKAIDIG